MNKKLENKLQKKIRVIPNFPKKGIQFQDITSITDNKQLFTDVVNEISTTVDIRRSQSTTAIYISGANEKGGGKCPNPTSQKTFFLFQML